MVCPAFFMLFHGKIRHCRLELGGTCATGSEILQGTLNTTTFIVFETYYVVCDTFERAVERFPQGRNVQLSRDNTVRARNC